ncbi:hypothetical protein Y032_0001g95 [Ancylostoma ceylanicum]|uniref:Carbohydrate kinase FGGY C-terminal domain-containing protein n=1 Tax=Ancylostoma ceylanicum TaxID=53326 RepID=A0A016W5Y1_9BILA|nr:hypothetical protein Y032_0001g95 [Ancylostoma ceylanicum]
MNNSINLVSLVGRLFLTGGASTNVDLQRILSDMFAMDAYVLNVPDSAALGGAMLARYVYYAPSLSYYEYYKDTSIEKVAEPDMEKSRIYEHMLPGLASLCSLLPEKS